MSKLQELINEYCPDGVEYRTVGEVCEKITDYTAAGSFADVAKNVKYSHDENEYAQLIRTTDLKSNFSNVDTFVFVNEHAFNYLWRVNLDEECLVLPNVGNCGEVYYVTPEILVHKKNVLGPNAILVKSSSVNNRYLYHVFSSRDFQFQLSKIISTTGQTKYNKTNFKQLLIPTPPLAVQSEIVRILDHFTLLTAELTAELTARKKQYEYYRDLLLTYPKIDDATLTTTNQSDRLSEIKYLQEKYGYAIVSLNEVIVSLNTGLNPRKFFRLNTDGAKNYYITIREIQDGNIVPSDATDRIDDEALQLCNNRSHLEKGDVLFSGTGTIGETAVIKETPVNWNIKEGVYTLKPNQDLIIPDYLRYILMTSSIKMQYSKKIAGGTVKSIPMKDMKMLLIPLPTISEQERLVSLVSRFDMLAHSISTGLPAEIEARKKQYEYYRDKLLTFKAKA